MCINVICDDIGVVVEFFFWLLLNFRESNRPPRRNCPTCDVEGCSRRTATDTIVVLVVGDPY